MKKKLISLLLILAVVIGVTAISVMAEETPAHSNHCVCGGNGNGRGDHVCADSGVITEWTPFSVDLLVYDENGVKDFQYSLPSGNYYLTGNTTISGKSITILPDAEVTFCLNGYTLTTTSRSFRVHGTLNITDCQPTRDGETQNGKISSNAGSACVLYGYAGGHVNLYRGILTGKEGVTRNFGGVVALGKDKGAVEEEAGSSMTMYGGTIDASKMTLVKQNNGSNGSGGAVILMGAAGKGCTFVQYNGTVKAAKSVEVYGAAIYSSNAADSIQILGGKVTAGTAKNLGNGIFMNKGGELVVGGNCNVADLFVRVGQTLTVQNLTGNVGLSTENANFAALGICTEAEFARFSSTMPANHALSYSEGNLAFVANHADHCVCGGNLTGVAAENHTCAETIPTWTALTAENIVCDAGITVASDRDSKYNMFAESGCYYLTENIDLEKVFEIRPGQDITICLNGFELTNSGKQQSLFRITGGKLSVCDCIGTGTVTTPYTGAGAVALLLNGYADATEGVTFNLYGGNLVATGTSTTNSGGVVQISNQVIDTPAIMNMYGGTITGTSRKTAGSIYMVNSPASVLNIYGGTITGGSSAGAGGNIYCTSGTINMYGGVISDGTATTHGGNMYIGVVNADEGRAGKFNMYGGTVTGGVATSYGGNIYMDSKDKVTTAVAECNISAGTVENGSASDRGGNIFVNRGYFTMTGGSVTGGSLTTHTRGLDIGLGANSPVSFTLNGKVNIGEIGVYGHSSNTYSIKLGKNFSAENVINIQSVNLDKVISGATKATSHYFAATNENAQLVYEDGAIYMRDAAVHYACYCGGTYEEDGSSITHTCSLLTDWVAVNADFLANSTTTTEEVAGTGNPTTETVTTVTGWGTPVNYENASLGGTFYEIPTGNYYLTEDLVLEHGLRVVKGADVKIDLNGHTITAPSDNARALFLQGSLRICDSSYNPGKENKAEQFQGGIIAARAANYSLAYVSADGELRIYGGNYYSTADCSANTQGLIGATGKIYFFDGYYVASGMNGNGALVVLQVSGTKSGSLAVRKATLVGAAAKNGGIIASDAEGTSLKIYSGNLIGSTVNTFGGAIYMNKGDLEVRGGTITGGTAIRGGNIHMGAETTTKVVKGTISNGTATGAASGSNGGGGNIYTAGAIEISGGTITGGSATRTQSSTQAYGGNVYQNDTTAAKLFKISGGTIENGSAVTGGNIFVRGIFEMTNGTITGGNAVEATAGNLRLEGKNGNTATITGGTISNGTSVQQGGNLFVRNYTGAVVISNATITGGSCTGNHGGSVYVTGLTSSLTMENTTITGGSAYDRGGNLYIVGGAEELAVVTLTNCTITDGTAGSRGGNIYVADVDATLNNCTVTGGQIVLTGAEEDVLSTYGYNLATNYGNYDSKLTINGGTYKDAGENNVSPTSFHLLSGADHDYTLTISGLLEIDDLRLGTGRMLYVGEAGLEEGSSIGISRFEVTGLIAPGAAQYQNCFRTDYENALFTDVVGEDLYIISDNPYWAFTAGNKQLGSASSIEEAYEKYEDIGFVRVVQPNAYVGGELMQLDKPVYLDINGSQYAGLIVGSPIYVIDSKTNKYEEGAAGIFAYDLIAGGSVNDGKTVINSGDCGVFNSNVNYVMVDEGGFKIEDVAEFNTALSFHAFKVEISHISLQPGADALGFKATISGDSKVMAAITGYGFNMSVEGGNQIAFTKTGAPADGVFSLRLKNILKNGGGEMSIIGEPVIFFGEELSAGNEKNTTMKGAIESVEKAVAENPEAYTQAQIEAVQALLAQYEEQVAAWDIDSIKAWTVPTTEPEETPAA